MKFTPYYTVSYQGGFHPAGKPFDIDEKDAAEMQKHGLVEETPPEDSVPEETPPRGRTAKK